MSKTSPREAVSIISPLGFRICFGLRTSYFGFIPRAELALKPMPSAWLTPPPPLPHHAPMRPCTLGILSDIHYAGPAEQARGHDYELRAIPNPRGCVPSLVRSVTTSGCASRWARTISSTSSWRGPASDYLIANGDYSSNTAFVGAERRCRLPKRAGMPGKLRQRFGANLRANFGDHELGKTHHVRRQRRHAPGQLAPRPGGTGFGPLLAARNRQLRPAGFVSTLVALPVFEADTLPAERPEWERLRAEHLAEIRRAFDALQPASASCSSAMTRPPCPSSGARTPPRPAPANRADDIGHLHSNLVFWQSRLLAGMPPIRFLGHSVQRLSTALSQARLWRPFHVRLCPALAGIQLLKDGGYCTIELDPEARQPAQLPLPPPAPHMNSLSLPSAICQLPSPHRP